MYFFWKRKNLIFHRETHTIPPNTNEKRLMYCAPKTFVLPEFLIASNLLSVAYVQTLNQGVLNAISTKPIRNQCSQSYRTLQKQLPVMRTKGDRNDEGS